MNLTLGLLRFLPKNLLSRAFGWIARRRRPRFLVRPFMRWFARRFDLDLSEAEKPFEDYPSLHAMFTRALRPGARPIDATPGVLVSPVDGRVGAFGRVREGRLVQAKGIDYGVDDLLGSDSAAEPFAAGSFLTLYLSPRDYHRIHAPEGGRIVSSLYEPGTLWPVNPPAVRRVPRLFAVNERVTTMIETDRGPVAVVMVGATNVGRIRLAYDDLVTNAGGRREERRHEPSLAVERGGQVGTFELGSTVILVVADPEFSWEGLAEGLWVPMGRLIGRRAPA